MSNEKFSVALLGYPNRLCSNLQRESEYNPIVNPREVVFKDVSRLLGSIMDVVTGEIMLFVNMLYSQVL